MVKQPVTYEDYMKLLWNNTANKTKDSLDKLLSTFSTAYEKFEEESISSLAVSLQNTCLQGFVNNKGADQPKHPRTLISTMVISYLKIIVVLYETSLE